MQGHTFNSCCLLSGSDAVGPLAVGLLQWKNPHMYGNPRLPLTFSEDACVPVFPCFATQSDFSYPLSCPASLSITPVPSYSSSSQETLSQDSTGKWLFLFYVSEVS